MNIFIGCSSKNEINSKYFEETKKVLHEIINNNDLVFGVSHNGIMGLCYNEFKNANRKIIGITNEIYSEEFETIPCDEEYIVYSTLDRTKLIVEKSDIFLFLPGGIGTYAEIFHIYEELRTYKINKKIILYNYDKFYNDLIKIINELVKGKFIEETLLKYINVVNTSEEIISLIKK